MVMLISSRSEDARVICKSGEVNKTYGVYKLCKYCVYGRTLPYGIPAFRIVYFRCEPERYGKIGRS